MKTSFLTSAALAALALAGCASTSEESSGADVTPQMAADSAELQTYRIRSWSAPNDRTLIVEALDGTRYKAELLAPCFGLDFATRIGFVNRGLNQLDRFAGVVLPDGTRCSFRSFNEIVTPATSARDAEAEEAKKKDAKSPKANFAD
jgi:hypothetical protein